MKRAASREPAFRTTTREARIAGKDSSSAIFPDPDGTGGQPARARGIPVIPKIFAENFACRPSSCNLAENVSISIFRSSLLKHLVMFCPLLITSMLVAQYAQEPSSDRNTISTINLKSQEANVSLSEKEALEKAANSYVNILNKIGESQGNPDEIMCLCANHCKKVRNGKLLFEKKEDFPAQLREGKEWLGAWLIAEQEVLIATETRTATVRYRLATEKEGDLIVIVVLYFDSSFLIKEINEVHNRLER